MIDYTIPTMIGVVLAFVLGATIGALWGLSRYEWLYCRVTSRMMQRMREAMTAVGIEEWKIYKAQEYMGTNIIPPYIPMPKPPVKVINEQVENDDCISHADREREKRDICIDSESVLLSRAWFVKHGWEPTKDIPLFKHDPEYIDADLCVIDNRKNYIVAQFHNMGDDAWNHNAQPSYIEVVGVNNRIGMADISFSRLLMAVSICEMVFFDVIRKGIGGKYEMTISKKG